MKKLFDQLKDLIENIESNPFIPKEKDNLIQDYIIQLLFDYNDGNLLKAFLFIDQLNKERIKKENLILYRGLEDGMHNFVSLAKHLLEDSNSKQAKETANFYFKTNNIAMLINIAKAYFPKGNCNGASENGKWFFTQFKNLLKEYSSKYLEGGSSYDWAISYNHLDYIKKVLENEE